MKITVIKARYELNDVMCIIPYSVWFHYDCFSDAKRDVGKIQEDAKIQAEDALIQIMSPIGK